MKRLILTAILFITPAIVGSSRVYALDCTAERCATCDLCGFCQLNGTPKPTPGNWESCRNCLYPALTGSSADSMETLRVDPATNIPITPQSGTHYTMIGCVSTGDAFVNSGAASGLVNKLLDLIFKTVGAIAFLYLIYGAFLILSSRSEPERLNQGKGMVYGALIGLIFSLMSVFLVNLIAQGILRIPGFSPTPTPQ